MSELTLQFPVTGLSCAGCVGRAEKALGGVNGVSSVQVNLANEMAQVTGAASAAELAGALEKAGYPAATRELHLRVNAMHCGACVSKVEKLLLAEVGVIDASVNLAAETATVTVLKGARSDKEIIEAVSVRGYPASNADDAVPGSTQEDSLAARQSLAAAQLTRLTWIAGLLTLPVFILAMGTHLFAPLDAWVSNTLGTQNSWMIQFVLTTIVLVWPGRQFFEIGVPALLKAAPEMNTLVAIGTFAAWAYSSVATFMPGALPADSLAVYFESAAVIVTLILLGRSLEARARGRTGQAIASLMALQPKTARIQRGPDPQDEQEIAIESIQVGDVLNLRPGERVAIDGKVVSGNSYIDESMLSGEPMPVAKKAGDIVTGGTVNGSGALSFEATRVGADTTIAQIIRLVEQAQGARLPVQALVNRITSWFVPIVLALAALTLLAWLALGPSPAVTHALVAAVAVLIIACPCAMGLATPTSIMVGTGRAANLGVLFRQGQALQTLQDTRIIAIDKTGTLTVGKPTLSDCHVDGSFTREQVLSLAAAVEVRSEHPIAQAIVDSARSRQLEIGSVEQFESITGHGVSGLVAGRRVLAGNARLLERQGINPGKLQALASQLAAEGKTPVLIAIDAEPAAVLAVSDPVRPDSAAAIAALKAKGLTVAMITGDSHATATVVARTLGIDHVIADVLPEGKVQALNKLQQQVSANTSGSTPGITFVGDGINDAPALAAADVGIAIGTGTDVAIESADVVLMSGSLRGVVTAYEVSSSTMRNIRQNLFWAFGYNVLLIPVATGLFYPLNGLQLSPMLAAGAMAFSSVFVLFNALRLRWITPGALPTSDA